MRKDIGRSGADAPSGQSAKPEPSCTVSAQGATVPNAESLPCIVCRRALEDAIPNPSQGNQPYPGLEFTTGGHYGSTIFDLEPGVLVVNVCDDCVTSASREGLVRLRTFFGRPHEAREHPDVEWLNPKAIATEALTTPKGEGWLPIETAPNDELLLVWDYGSMQIALRSEGKWHSQWKDIPGPVTPTFWRSLPKPPKGTAR